MNRRLYSILTLVAVSFVLVLGFGTFNVAKAVPGTSGERVNAPQEGSDLFGVDTAANSLGTVDRDPVSGGFMFVPNTYGLHGTLQP